MSALSLSDFNVNTFLTWRLSSCIILTVPEHRRQTRRHHKLSPAAMHNRRSILLSTTVGYNSTTVTNATNAVREPGKVCQLLNITDIATRPGHQVHKGTDQLATVLLYYNLFLFNLNEIVAELFNSFK